MTQHKNAKTSDEGRIAYRIVGVTDATPTLEDGGQAMIVELDDPDAGDPHMFVRLQSWHDGATKTDDSTHPTLRSLLGRRVRITIEDLGPADART